MSSLIVTPDDELMGFRERRLDDNPKVDREALQRARGMLDAIDAALRGSDRELERLHGAWGVLCEGEDARTVQRRLEEDAPQQPQEAEREGAELPPEPDGGPTVAEATASAAKAPRSSSESSSSSVGGALPSGGPPLDPAPSSPALNDPAPPPPRSPVSPASPLPVPPTPSVVSPPDQAGPLPNAPATVAADVRISPGEGATNAPREAPSPSPAVVPRIPRARTTETTSSAPAVPVAVLPFEGKSAPPPLAPPTPEEDVDPLNQTAGPGALNVSAILPFRRDDDDHTNVVTPEAPGPPPAPVELTLAQHAALHAECQLYPQHQMPIEEKYGVPPGQRPALEAHWNWRFEREPRLLPEWRSHFDRYVEWLRSQRS